MQSSYGEETKTMPDGLGELRAGLDALDREMKRLFDQCSKLFDKADAFSDFSSRTKERRIACDEKFADLKESVDTLKGRFVQLEKSRGERTWKLWTMLFGALLGAVQMWVVWRLTNH